MEASPIGWHALCVPAWRKPGDDMTRFALLPLLLTACATGPRKGGGATTSACADAGGAACFADATDDELRSAADAALGVSAVVSYLLASAAITDAYFSIGDDCMVVEETGDTLILTAEGCDGDVSGATWSGELRWQNPSLFTLYDEEGNEVDVTLAYDEDAPSVITFTDWVAVTADASGDVTRRINGTIAMSPSSVEPVTTTVDLDYAVDDRPASTTRSETACSTGAKGYTCAEVEPTQGEVDGLGSFTVTPQLEEGEVVALLLEGADSLTLTPSEDGECLSLGGALDYCEDEIYPTLNEGGGPVDDGDLAILTTGMGTESGTGGDFFWFHAGVIGEAGGVDCLVLDTVAEELGTEAYTLEDADGDGLWEVKVGVGEDCATSECSALPFADADLLAIQYRLYDTDGELVSCAFFSDEVEDPSAWFDTSDCPRID
jgi:hypothetical protein